MLSVGALFTGTALLLEWWVNQRLWLSVLLLVIPVSVLFVVRKFRLLYSLSKNYEASDKNQAVLKERIVGLSSDNPKWIMIVTQTYGILSIILLASKFIL